MHRHKLESIAIQLGITNPCEYKNKASLIRAIDAEIQLQKTAQIDTSQPQSQSRHERCYNRTDPCTLIPLDEIPNAYYIEWDQYNHRFGADARSLKQMMDNHQFILPWSIDFSSGCQASIDHEKYTKSFDMRLIDGLVKAVYEKAISNSTDMEMSTESTEQITPAPFNNVFLYEIDNLTGGNAVYSYGSIINNILQNDDMNEVFEMMASNMLRVLLQTGPGTDVSIAQRLHADIFYQYVYVIYTIKGFHIRDKQEHLYFILQILHLFREVVGQTVASEFLQLLFIDM